MPSSYTTSLRLTLPATGELSGQWGNTVNTGITELLDAAVAGTTTISTWGGLGVAYTLSNNSGTADEARRMFIVATGTPGEAKNVICPAVSKMYVFRNDTTGGFALTLKTSGGTGIAVPAGQYKLLYCDGTNVVEAVNSLGPVAALTASQAVFTDASKNLVSNAITGTGNVVMSTSPTLVTPVLGTPTSVTLTNATGLPLSTGVTGTLATTNGGTGLTSFTSGGVVYASSTSALTTGSALTFDGTTLNNNQSSAASGLMLNLQNTTTGSFIQFAMPGVANVRFGSPNADAFVWQTFGSGAYPEQMRLTSSGLEVKQSQLIGYSSYAGIGTNGLAVAGNVGIGTSSPATLLDLRTSNGVSAILRLGSSSSVTNSTVGTIEFYDGDADDAGIKSSISNVITGNVGPGGAQGGNLLFSTAISGASPTERARISSDGTFRVKGAGTAGSTDAVQFSGSAPASTLILDSSGNLGIGTSSPATKLHVVGTSGTGTVQIGTSAGANEYQYITFGGANGGTDFGWQVGRSSNTSGIGGDGALYFYDIKANANRMSIDSSGNLGLGVTPSAWNSSYKAFQFGSGSIATVTTGEAAYLHNAYIDASGNYTYVNTAAAARYSQSGGVHYWFNAPSGTAGNAISFTQAMTLTSGGNLLVGTTSSPSQQAVIYRTSATTSNGALLLDGNGSYAGVQFASSGTLHGSIGVDSSAMYFTHGANLIFKTGATNNVGGTERARITSGGSFLMTKDNVIGINTSDAADNGYLALFGAGADGITRGGGIYLSGNERSVEAGSVIIQAGDVATTGIIAFRTGGIAEKARISADGTFRVKGAGAAGSTDAFQVSGSAPASAMTLDSSGNLSVTGTITSGKGANVASATTVTLGAGNFFDITGTTTISAITIKPAGTVVYLKFDSSLTLQTGTIGSSGAMRLTGGASLGVTQYDVLTLISDGTNWWQVAYNNN